MCCRLIELGAGGGRRARLIEYDPIYCDTIITRWQRLTGKHAVLAGTGERFEDVVEQRTFGILCSDKKAEVQA